MPVPITPALSAMRRFRADLIALGATDVHVTGVDSITAEFSNAPAQVTAASLVNDTLAGVPELVTPPEGPGSGPLAPLTLVVQTVTQTLTDTVNSVTAPVLPPTDGGQSGGVLHPVTSVIDALLPPSAGGNGGLRSIGIPALPHLTTPAPPASGQPSPLAATPAPPSTPAPPASQLGSLAGSSAP